MSKHRSDLPRSYRRLQPPGERRVWLRYMKPRMARWFAAPYDRIEDSDLFPDVTPQAETIHAFFIGGSAPVGPPQSVEPAWARVYFGHRNVERVQDELRQKVIDLLLQAPGVVDIDDEIEFTFSAILTATARVKAWPDKVPGVTSIPWKPVANGSIGLPRNYWKKPDLVRSKVIPALMNAVHQAELDGAFRVAILCEPETARLIRETAVGEYFELVEDNRRQPGVLVVATEV